MKSKNVTAMTILTFENTKNVIFCLIYVLRCSNVNFCEVENCDRNCLLKNGVRFVLVPFLKKYLESKTIIPSQMAPKKYHFCRKMNQNWLLKNGVQFVLGPFLKELEPKNDYHFWNGAKKIIFSKNEPKLTSQKWCPICHRTFS